MKYGLKFNFICLMLFLICTLKVQAVESEHSVVIEVVTNGMTADKVEESIANPIEILMSNLTDVLLISAKYQENEAEITVKFNKDAAEQSNLVGRVRKVLDDNMNRLPDNIVTMSVSLASLLPDNPNDKIREAPVRSYVGSYLGNIQSSNELLPILTTFFQEDDPTSSASGNYLMNEAKSVVRGDLTNCRHGAGYVIDCYWRDRYGSGTVAFTFSDDYKHFSGKWRLTDQPFDFKWTGVEVSVTR